MLQVESLILVTKVGEYKSLLENDCKVYKWRMRVARNGLQINLHGKMFAI